MIFKIRPLRVLPSLSITVTGVFNFTEPTALDTDQHRLHLRSCYSPKMKFASGMDHQRQLLVAQRCLRLFGTMESCRQQVLLEKDQQHHEDQKDKLLGKSNCSSVPPRLSNRLNTWSITQVWHAHLVYQLY